MPLPFILGIALGAGSVILYNNRDKAKGLAKKSNRVMKKKLSQGMKGVQSVAGKLEQEAGEAADKLAADSENIVERAADQMEDFAEEAADKAEDAAETLDDELTDLSDR